MVEFDMKVVRMVHLLVSSILLYQVQATLKVACTAYCRMMESTSSMASILSMAVSMINILFLTSKHFTDGE